jgi:arginine:agmatine antiporter
MTAAAPPAEKPLGLVTCTCLVIGNVVGAGFYLSPTVLAPFGMVAVLGWFLLALGAMCIGLVFARLSSIAPAAGGPYAFARQAFGPLSGFIVAWTYWISIWASLPAIALTLATYLVAFFPAAEGKPAIVGLVALASMWAVCLLSFRGAATVGLMQRIAVGVKLLPFVAVGTIGLFWVRPENLLPLNPSSMPVTTALSTLAPLVMFAFLGIESATVPAGEVSDPKRTIPRATLIGTGICALVYIFCTIAVMGVIPRGQLAASASPFTDAATAMWGHWAGVLMGVAVVVSSFAALNGWILLLGQVPLAAARDGAFPRVFGRTNSHGAPFAGLMVSLSLSSVLLIAQSVGGRAVAAAYEFIVSLSTTANMVPYMFCAVAEAMLVRAAIASSKGGGWRIGPFTPAAVVAFLFSLWIVYGSGETAAMWTLLLMFFALPIYVLLAQRAALRATTTASAL